MQISVEISLYPFTPAYEAPILDFIKRLNENPVLKIHTNNMSTQIVGPYDEVMQVLQKELKPSMTGERTTIAVMKILNYPIEL